MEDLTRCPSPIGIDLDEQSAQEGLAERLLRSYVKGGPATKQSVRSKVHGTCSVTVFRKASEAALTQAAQA